MASAFLFFTAKGKARFAPTCIAVLVISTLSAWRSSHGFFRYNPTDLLTILVPVAGTVVALALPAAQLAQSIVENFLSGVGELSKRPVRETVKFFSSLAVQRRRDMSSMFCVVVYSLCAFLLGVADLLGVFSGLTGNEYEWARLARMRFNWIPNRIGALVHTGRAIKLQFWKTRHIDWHA